MGRNKREGQGTNLKQKRGVVPIYEGQLRVCTCGKKVVMDITLASLVKLSNAEYG